MSWLSSDTGKSFWTWIPDGRVKVMEEVNATEEVNEMAAMNEMGAMNAMAAMNTMNETDG